MDFEYENKAMKNGVFGPNKVGHTYKPMNYHGVKSRPKKGKTRWAYPAPAEYHVFNLADEHEGKIEADGIPDKRWVNDDGEGLYSLVDDCRVVLGKDNEERFAYFKNPVNDSDPWHGYPIGPKGIGDELIEYWHKKNFISDSTYLRLNRCQGE